MLRGVRNTSIEKFSVHVSARNNITIGTRNVRSLRAAGKIEGLIHKVKRYRWNIIGLCEVRWKNFGEKYTPECLKLFFSGREDRSEHGVGYIIHRDTVNAIMGCRPVFSRLNTIRLRASPFNITIIQAQQLTTMIMTLKTIANCKRS